MKRAVSRLDIGTHFWKNNAEYEVLSQDHWSKYYFDGYTRCKEIKTGETRYVYDDLNVEVR